MKSGYKTTEFWLTFAAMIVATFMAAGIFAEGHWSLRLAGMAGLILAKLGYTSGRARAKVADSLGKLKPLPEAETPPE